MKVRAPRSLIARVLLAEAAVIAVAALLLPLLMISVLRRTTRDFQDPLLLDQAQTVAAGVRRDAAGRWAVNLPNALSATYSTRYDGRAYVVVTGAGRIVAASRYADLMPWNRVPRAAEPRALHRPPFVGVSLPAQGGGMQLWVIVTQDESGPGAIVDDIAASFLPRYAAILLGVLLLLPLVNSVLIRRLVISVERVSHQARGIGAHRLDARLAAGGLPSEVEPLVAATNALLARLEQSFRRQEQFVANVAHELRTPLATLRLRLEGVTDPAVRRPLERQVARLSHVIHQLHDLGSLEHVAQGRTGRFDLAALAEEVVAEQAHGMIEDSHPVSLVVETRPIEIEGNRFLAGIALTNLLDNAARHTPAGTPVTVTVGAGAVMSVEDEGPGLASDGAEGRRFWRADHVRSDSAGLGLSIVRRIAEVHGGSLTIGNRRPHGASIVLRLAPAAPPIENG